jgi:hypothetical protein
MPRDYSPELVNREKRATGVAGTWKERTEPRNGGIMATAYQTADEKVRKVVDQAVDQWHQPLRKVKLLLGVLVAQNLDGPGVRHNGYPALASIRVVPLKDRVTKGYDAELLIDEREWNTMKVEHRHALCDHMLAHLVIVKEKKSGEVKYDDLGRPKLRTRKGDWTGGEGFAEVVERHGNFAVEFLQAQRAFNKAKDAAARKPSLLNGIEPATEAEKNPDAEPSGNPVAPAATASKNGAPKKARKAARPKTKR